MDIYTNLARQSIKDYLEETETNLEDLPIEILARKAGCFVSLHAKNGQLRGCMGTFEPIYKNLAQEIFANAIAASQHDNRFKPVTLAELDNIKISVDILNQPEAINSEKDLDFKKYGVIVQSLDGRNGLLLPDIENVNSNQEQIKIAKQKAGIQTGEKVLLYRFTVERHSEN